MEGRVYFQFIGRDEFWQSPFQILVSATSYTSLVIYATLVLNLYVNLILGFDKQAIMIWLHNLIERSEAGLEIMSREKSTMNAKTVTICSAESSNTMIRKSQCQYSAYTSLFVKLHHVSSGASDFYSDTLLGYYFSIPDQFSPTFFACLFKAIRLQFMRSSNT